MFALIRRCTMTCTVLSLAIASQPLQAQDLSQVNRQYQAAVQAGNKAEAYRLGRLYVQLAEQAGQTEYVAIMTWNLGKAYYEDFKFAEAARFYEKALAAYERLRGADHLDVVECVVKLAYCFEDLGRYADAEALCKRRLDRNQRVLGATTITVAYALNNLANVYKSQGRYAEAEAAHMQALAIKLKLKGSEHEDTYNTRFNLANVYSNQGRFAEAEDLHKRTLVWWQKKFGNDEGTAKSHSSLASVYKYQGRYDEAEAEYRKAYAIRSQIFGLDHPTPASTLSDLAWLAKVRGRLSEAEELERKALAIKEKHYGSDHMYVATNLNRLALIHMDLGRHREAEEKLHRSIEIWEKTTGPDHPNVTYGLGNLGSLYNTLGRYTEADSLHRRVLILREKTYGADHLDVAWTLNEMSLVYANQGRYADAEAAQKRALAIREKFLGRDHLHLAWGQQSLAWVYYRQGRYPEAEPLDQRALAIYEKILPPNHAYRLGCMNDLALVCEAQKRLADAEQLYRRVIAIKEKEKDLESPSLANPMNNLGLLLKKQGRLDEASDLFRRAQTLYEKAYGTEHPSVTYALNNLAEVLIEQNRPAEAERLLDRVIAIRDKAGVGPDLRFAPYYLRANLSWKKGKRDEALADLGQALNLAEQQRAHSGGAEQERAQAFSQFSKAFETMIAWQAELGNIGEAVRAMERGRARSLLDELNLAGADLQIGRPIVEREQLRQQELILKSKVATLEKQLEQTTLAAAKRQRLAGELAEAQAQLYAHFRDARNTNPIYRSLLAVGGALPRLSQVQQQLLKDDALLLVYFFGEEAAYVAVITADKARLEKLELDAPAAKALGTDPGPLTAARLQGILLNEQKTGLVQHLADEKKATATGPRLAALWSVLVPAAERKALIAGQVKRLLVVPDGALALLPFEALVVEGGQRPRYLLDLNVPIVYGPSATVLFNLAQRPVGVEAAEPVLTVGAPKYGPADETTASATELTGPRTGYRAGGGRLPALPFSGQESDWVTENYRKVGAGVMQLRGPRATEANLRASASGRRLIHLACHGLTDLTHGNFFGALAVTPGKEGDPADDGFLTLAELYELNLRSCELAILSACETNFGPQQKGEGVWALSRGFLVAGARRVAASNWLVDDEAAASLVSLFTELLAQRQKAGQPLDHAGALHQAKRWLRQQEKWQSPYFWAPLVLVGPD